MWPPHRRRRKTISASAAPRALAGMARRRPRRQSIGRPRQCSLRRTWSHTPMGRGRWRRSPPTAADGDMVMDDAAAEQVPQITETMDLEEFIGQLILRTDAHIERIRQESKNSTAAFSGRCRELQQTQEHVARLGEQVQAGSAHTERVRLQVVALGPLRGVGRLARRRSAEGFWQPPPFDGIASITTAMHSASPVRQAALVPAGRGALIMDLVLDIAGLHRRELSRRDRASRCSSSDPSLCAPLRRRRRPHTQSPRSRTLKPLSARSAPTRPPMTWSTTSGLRTTSGAQAKRAVLIDASLHTRRRHAQ